MTALTDNKNMFIALLLASGMAFDTGNTLYAQCLDQTLFSQGRCVSYIRGVTDLVNTYQDAGIGSKLVCIPSNVTPGQLEDIVVKDLRDDPVTRNQGAAGLVAATLMKAFPCAR